MVKSIEYGVILAAGDGKRMKPLSDYFPKVTLPILDKPLLIHHFSIMEMIGVKKVFIIVSETNKTKIQEIIKDDSHINLSYEFVIQKTLRGTGHAVLLLEKKLNNKRFLLLLGDEYYNDTSSFKTLQASEKNSLIMGLIEYDNIDHIKAGCNVHLHENIITRLVEKPKEDKIEGKWCWDGSLVLDATIFPVLKNLKESSAYKKDGICLVKAMQILIENEHQIAVIKKNCKNINMTSDLDFFRANLIEYDKKYGSIILNNVINEVLK
ncbi:MAG TPA: sugar phosphate nucleotidyltransferase [Draconibacterium sp.]|nr:sugar phosphate nucleotidyltransferase [Draconibacterium sp.]